MLATSVRERPCSDLDTRSSSGRSIEIVPSSAREAVMGSATAWLSVPLGPLTVTSWPSMEISTPDGTGTGNLPMRLMSVPSLPDVGEDFPAHSTLGGLTISQQAG